MDRGFALGLELGLEEGIKVDGIGEGSLLGTDDGLHDG